MDNNNSVTFNITSGPSKDRIFDAFKYARGAKIDLCFRLQEADIQPPGGFCFGIQSLGAENAVADEYFSIKSIEYIEQSDWRRWGNVIRLVGDCDLFYLDADDRTGFDAEKSYCDLAAYHVDFNMIYDTESHKGTMSCSNFRDCYYDPWDY